MRYSSLGLAPLTDDTSLQPAEASPPRSHTYQPRQPLPQIVCVLQGHRIDHLLAGARSEHDTLMLVSKPCTEGSRADCTHQKVPELVFEISNLYVNCLPAGIGFWVIPTTPSMWFESFSATLVTCREGREWRDKYLSYGAHASGMQYPHHLLIGSTQQ